MVNAEQRADLNYQNKQWYVVLMCTPSLNLAAYSPLLTETKNHIYFSIRFGVSGQQRKERGSMAEELFWKRLESQCSPARVILV